MDKFTYFTSALHAGCAGRTHWVTSCFSAMTHEVYDPGKHKLADDDAPKLIRDQAVTYQFRIFRFNKDSHEVGFIHRENEEVKLVSLGELKPMASIFSFTEKTMVNNTVIPTAPEQAIETTYGNILVNWLLFFLPFGLKIPFQTGKLDGGKCDDLVNEKYARSLPKKGEERDPKLIYVDEYLKYQKNASYLDSWSNFATASATLAGLSPNPEVAKFIKTKLKELGHPPSVSELAAIEEQAAKLDKDLFKGTEDENFLSGKNIKVGRKKMFYIYGLEEGFGLSTIVEAPLSEGVKAEDLPDYANALRAASFNRGAQTALGGVGVKRINQIFQAINVRGDDCKDTEGYSYVAYDEKDFFGTYVFMKDGVRIPTEEEAKALLGQLVRIRSPMSCKEKAPHYCAKCVGTEIAMLPNGVHNTLAAISSKEMLIFMKAMHGRSLSTVEYSIERSIS